MLPSLSSRFRLEYMVASLSSYSPEEFAWISFDISYPYLSPLSSSFRMIVSVWPLSRSDEILLGDNGSFIGVIYIKVLCLSRYFVKSSILNDVCLSTLKECMCLIVVLSFHDHSRC